jgi:pimeloyl-ACP methyl ester carboxylesterase
MTILYRASDGTAIGCTPFGNGSPLILVHGVSVDSTFWLPVVPALANAHRVLSMDRRGRGDSGDHPEYEIEKEFSDLAGLIDSIGEPVDVVGHSFGALCALEAALLTRNVRRIVAYEPPLPGAWPNWPEALRNEMLPLLAVGKNEEALCSFLSILMSVAPEDIAQMRALPAWPGRVALANTIPRELEALVNVKFDMSRLRNVTCPTTFLVGGASPQFQMEIASAYKSALRKAEVRILEGQGHLAVSAAPDLVVAEIRRSLA